MKPRTTETTPTMRCLRPLFVLLPLLGGCALLPDAPAADPLIGQIWHATEARPMERDALIDEAAASEVIYVGEKHDNPRHHAIQLELLDALLARDLKPALAFEFFSLEQTGYLRDYVDGEAHGQKPEAREQQLRERLGWGEARDDDWAHYLPLLQRAREHALPVVGADLPAALRLRLPRVGLDGLSGWERAQLRPTGFDDPAYRELMFRELTDSHCGWRHEPLLEKLYQTWVARNDVMARAVVSALEDHPGQPVLMVLGAGHVRHDYGVPERVRALRPGTRQLNIGLQEVARAPQLAADYLHEREVDGVRFGPDYARFWFTARTPLAPGESDDPCERYAKQLKHPPGTPRPAAE